MYGGAVTLYERDGQYQLSAYDIQNMGQGSGSADYTALRQKLLAEGLLSPERKRKAPLFPRAIGVITSAEGAAVQDIITGMQRHNDLIPLILYPATVQGSAAVEQILYALHCVIAEIAAISLSLLGAVALPKRLQSSMMNAYCGQ